MQLITQQCSLPFFSQEIFCLSFSKLSAGLTFALSVLASDIYGGKKKKRNFGTSGVLLTLLSDKYVLCLDFCSKELLTYTSTLFLCRLLILYYICH